jgi:hypothetical protein
MALGASPRRSDVRCASTLPALAVRWYRDAPAWPGRNIGVLVALCVRGTRSNRAQARTVAANSDRSLCRLLHALPSSLPTPPNSRFQVQAPQGRRGAVPQPGPRPKDQPQVAPRRLPRHQGRGAPCSAWCLQRRQGVACGAGWTGHRAHMRRVADAFGSEIV